MDQLKQLAGKKSAIVKKWFDSVIDAYPLDTAHFLKSQKDPFANPVGQTTQQGLAGVLDLIFSDIDRQQAASLLDPMIRIRAIQDFTAARAVQFVFDLKDILRDMLGSGENLQALQTMQTIHRRVDILGLVAFDVYMQCREKLYDLQANEMRARTFRAFERAGLVKESDDKES